VDEEATKRERAARRQQRLERAGALPPNEVPASTEAGRQIAEYLEEASLNGGRVIRCRVCHHVLCAAGEDPLRFAVRRERPLAEAGPWLAIHRQGQSPYFVLVESICPSCGVLFDVQETRKAPA
ncbi:MAG: hypothetical protein AAB285_04630, partial [candidate division NC10 bacterium]